MKRIELLLSLATLVLVTACSFNELPDNLIPLPIAEEHLLPSVETRAETYEGESLDQEYFVTAEDLENFVKFRRSASNRSDFAVKDVKSYGFDSSQTLFYILNYDLGWEVVAADKRVQPTLAHGDNGTFSMDSDNEAMKYWMNMLADGVLQTRLNKKVDSEEDLSTASTEGNKSTEDALNDNVAFWDSISPQSEDATRGTAVNVPILGPVLPGDTTILTTHKYYLSHLTESYGESTYYGPYIQTRWGQTHPWNQCCPRDRRDGVTNEVCFAKAGCAPVAVGQILFYLQQKYNATFNSCEDVEYNYSGYSAFADYYDVYDPDIFSFVGESTGLWNEMATYHYERDGEEFTNGNTKYSAALLAYVGLKMRVDYSFAQTGILPTAIAPLFQEYNISCSERGYSPSTIETQLKESAKPVIIYAYPSNGEGLGHAWIIDGCYDYARIIRKYYILTTTVMDDNKLLTLTKEDATGYEDSVYNSEGDTFHMNWGWGGNSDGWYAKNSSSWTASSSTDHEYSASSARIIYNFRIQ